jgi:hypothetical protein
MCSEGDIAAVFLQYILAQARGARLPSDEHFTVDGALVVACANRRSFRRKCDGTPLPGGRGTPTVDLHGERRSKATPVSNRSPDSRPAKKATGQAAKVASVGEV